MLSVPAIDGQIPRAVPERDVFSRFENESFRLEGAFPSDLESSL